MGVTGIPEPIDPGLTTSKPRAAHSLPGLVLLVVVGGTAGTWARAQLENAVPAAPGGWPWATFLVNISGAFMLGVLLELLARNGPDSGWRRRIRLTAGTGFLGGYTTYSTFAVEVSQLTGTSPHVTGVAYALASVLLGPAAAALGIMASHALRDTSSHGQTT